MARDLVCFAHGKESGPWGVKITALAAVARALGFAVMSPDYSHTHDPLARVEQLLRLSPQASGKLELYSSSFKEWGMDPLPFFTEIATRTAIVST